MIGRAGIAWTVLLILVGVLLSRPFWPSPESESPEPPIDAMDDVVLQVMERQAKLFVASKPPGSPPNPFIASQASQLNVGSIGQRQRAVVLIYEMVGIEEADRALDTIDEKLGEAEPAAAPSAEDARTQSVLRTLYADTNPPDDAPDIDSIPPEDAAFLRQHLGWFGDLALHPVDQMTQQEHAALVRELWPVLAGALVGLIVVGLGGVGGFVGLVIVLVMALTRRLRSGLGPAVSHSGVYAETFVIWLVLFFGLQLVGLPIALALAPSATMPLAVVAFFASLIALAWPVWRGVPWRRVREDIGWTRGRSALAECGWGVACYAMMLPIILVGLILNLILFWVVGLFAGTEEGEFAPPMHPIIESIGGGPLQFLGVLALASIAAPIVEETAFRGLMYRQLRDSSRWMGVASSVVVSALVSAVIFAVIHPEGLLATPAKASIGIALALAREWRGSLIAPILMHAISNGLVMSLLWLILGS